MYKTINEIPTYNYYQCYFGNLSYVRSTFLDKFYPKPLLKRAFKKLKDEIVDLVGQDPIAVDVSQRANLITLMQIMTKASQNMIFATKEQKDRLLKSLKKIGLTNDLEHNIKMLERMIKIYERDASLLPKEEKTIEMAFVYRMASAISQKQSGRDVDIQAMPIAEFIENSKLLKESNKNG